MPARRRVAASAGGGGRALGPGSLPSPPRASPALVCLRAGPGLSDAQQKRLPSAGLPPVGFSHVGEWGEGAAALFPVSAAAPRPGTGGLSAAQCGGAGRGPQQLEGARAGRAGAAARGSLTDYSAAERSLPNPPLCPGPQPRARSDKLLSRRLPVRAKKRRRSRADAKSPALGPGEAGAGLQAGGGGPSLCRSPRPPALWLHSE